MKKPLIGFIGQGWIGKNYSDDFERRGYEVVRYSLEAPYNQNKEKIAECDIVFIAVPTPTTVKGFDDSIVEKVIPLASKGKIVVIKSTLIVGTTRTYQKKFKNHIVLHSPEFLSIATAAHDAAHPDRNIVGIPEKTKKHTDAAKKVLAILPKAPYEAICSSDEAEFIKYAHNIHGYYQIIFANLLFDLSNELNISWDEILKPAFKADYTMPTRYMSPIDKKGRGAGGHCFIKDFEAFFSLYKKHVKDPLGREILKNIREKNIELLLKTKKDLELLKGVYGSNIASTYKTLK